MRLRQITFIFAEGLKNTRGSALAQALFAVAMVSAISVGLFRYADQSAESVQAKFEGSRLSGVADLVASGLKHPDVCIQSIGFNGNIADKSIDLATIASSHGQAIVVSVPVYQEPMAPPGTALRLPFAGAPSDDPLFLDFGVRVAKLHLQLRGDPSDNPIVADVMASFLKEDRTGDAIPAGNRRITTLRLTLNDPRTVALSCSITGSAEAFCEDELGGRYDKNLKPPCQFGFKDLSCPTDHYLTGIDGSGNPICETLNLAPCPAGSVLIGITTDTNEDLVSECRRWAEPCRVGVGSVSWSNGMAGSDCSNSQNIWIPRGSSWPVGDLDGAKQGHADFRCISNAAGNSVLQLDLTRAPVCVDATPTTPTPTGVGPSPTTGPACFPVAGSPSGCATFGITNMCNGTCFDSEAGIGGGFVFALGVCVAAAHTHDCIYSEWTTNGQPNPWDVCSSIIPGTTSPALKCASGKAMATSTCNTYTMSGQTAPTRVVPPGPNFPYTFQYMVREFQCVP